MKKIKVFRFQVCDFQTKTEDYEKVKTEDTIEKTINEFIKDKSDVEIKVNTVDVKYHNNARCNTIHMIYTIVYTDNK